MSDRATAIAARQDRIVHEWMSECKTDDVEEALVAKGHAPTIYYYNDELPKRIFYIGPYQRSGEKGKRANKETEDENKIFLLLNIETGGFILVKPEDERGREEGKGESKKEV